MTILCIETSTRVCSVALTVNGISVAERIEKKDSNHARCLPIFVEELLQEAKQKAIVIEAVALSDGPGSYTGLRIGASTAKGICYGLHIPLIPVPTLQVLAVAGVDRIGGEMLPDSWLCPMVDARRMEVYTALYDKEFQIQGKVLAKVVEDKQWLLDINRDVYYFGDGAGKCQDILRGESLHYISDVMPEAKYMGLLAEQFYMLNHMEADVAYYEPFYLKEFHAAPSHVKGLIPTRVGGE